MKDTLKKEILKGFEDKFVTKNSNWRETGFTGDELIPPQEAQPMRDFLNNTIDRVMDRIGEEIIERKKDFRSKIQERTIENLNAFDGKFLTHKEIMELRDLGMYQELDNLQSLTLHKMRNKNYPPHRDISVKV